ncbi:MAG: hypothetical protein CFE25_14700 [Chitinophagaceae bacterium BSSC1]|nr:MAG: hypothetical protein CFE25_14700 [Chitinophagaceae bacterium BSSC1]
MIGMNNNKKAFLPFVLVFVSINLIALGFEGLMKSMHIDKWVVVGANCLLFLISLYNVYQHLKVVQQNNPHAMVRGVMGSTVLKLFVLGTAAFLYLYNAGEQKNINGLFIGMGLYLLYTWMDVRVALLVKPQKKDGGN